MQVVFDVGAVVVAAVVVVVASLFGGQKESLCTPAKVFGRSSAASDGGREGVHEQTSFQARRTRILAEVAKTQEVQVHIDQATERFARTVAGMGEMHRFDAPQGEKE